MIVKRRALVVPVLALALPLFAGCGSGGSSGPADAGVGPAVDLATPAPPDLAPPPYPAGPYGTGVGDRLWPIYSDGYMLSPTQIDYTKLPYGKIKIWDYVQQAQCKCLLVSIAAEWCGPCNMEQPDVIDGIMRNPGMCAFEVLEEGFKMGVPSTESDLQDWVGHYGQNFPVVISNIATTSKLPATGAIPTNAVVDPKTMQILDIWSGYDPNGIDTAMQDCGLK